MNVEVGSVFEGKITGITKFGAFVSFDENKTGMVHISEVSQTFVKEIKDFLTEGQEVKVKVISISEDGKVALSMKRVEEANRPAQRPTGRFEKKFDNNNNRPSFDKPPRKRIERPAPEPSPGRPGDFEWQSKGAQTGATNFEDMLSKFKQTSDEKISDLKRNTDTRRGSYSSRRESQK